jgi:OmcA/MtrC family decaheme c-type cytochrome
VYTPALLNSLPWSNVATGTPKVDASLSPYVIPGTNFGTGFSYDLTTGVYTEAAGTTLVNSPISSACFGCHDSTSAVSHMKLNGGSIYEARSTALYKVESCLVCHGPGRSAAIGTVHNPGQAAGH